MMCYYLIVHFQGQWFNDGDTFLEMRR